MLDFAGRIGCAFGQCSDFICHHCKSSTLITRPGGFDGCIQGQQIGLLGNGANGAKDLVDTAAAGFELYHGLRRLGQTASQAIHVVRGDLDLLLALRHTAMPVLGGLCCAAA
ncbi:hypothetical protein D3C76_1432870 [compost metagenome]